MLNQASLFLTPSKIEDSPGEKIQNYFDEAAEFIHNAVEEGKAVLST